MKILKIAGIVAGIHAFFLILIFAIPGCSSTTKPPPEPVDTVPSAPAPTISMPPALTASASTTPGPTGMGSPLLTPPPAGFNPDAPASYAESSGAVHFTPTRPNSPAASVLQTQPVADVTPAATYTVKAGDNLWSLAKKNHISTSELATANNLRTDSVLKPGHKLIIPGRASTSSTTTKTAGASAGVAASSSPSGLTSVKPADATPAPKGSGEDLKHVVKSGETLGEIAHKYGVKPRDLAVKNNIADPQKLRAGTELIIPGWSSTNGKSVKSSSAESAAKSTPSTSTPPPAAEPESAPPPPSNSVPVIHIDDNPITPAPKP
jgi:LysM repeat protein